MLIKSADDKSKRLRLLESLQNSELLDSDQKSWLNKELWALKEGIRGERDAAHYLDNHFMADDNLAVIHDLRLDVDGEVAQIDHLIISRSFVFYLLETKQYNGDLHINEFGEFSVSYGRGKVWSIPSPLEQSRRHQNVLVKLLARLGISGRIQKEPEFRHVVLVNPKAHIHRVALDVFDSSNVIKTDQFASWREKHVHGKTSGLEKLRLMANMRTASTVKKWAQALCAEHQSQEQLAFPEFMKPRARPPEAAAPRPAFHSAVEVESSDAAVDSVACARCDKRLSDAEQLFCSNHAPLFAGEMFCIAHQREYRQAKAAVQSAAESVANAAVEPETTDPRRRKLVCCTCGSKISFDEGRFCWGNERRFGGLQYCRTHQADIR